jgi:hypothetical protein
MDELSWQGDRSWHKLIDQCPPSFYSGIWEVSFFLTIFSAVVRRFNHAKGNFDLFALVTPLEDRAGIKF